MVAGRKLPLLLAIFFLGGAFSLPLGQAERPIDPEVRYTPDPEGYKSEFRATGRVTLRTSDGSLVLEGKEGDLIAGDNVWYTIPADGSSADMKIGGRIDSIAISGWVEGRPDPQVDLVLGEFGAYGVVETGEKNYHFNPEKTANGWEQKARTEVKVSRPAAPQPSGPSGGIRPMVIETPEQCQDASWVHYDAEQGFRDTHSDWVDRQISAFNRIDNLYCSEVGIALTSSYRAILGSILTSSKCDTTNPVSWQYRNWLVDSDDLGTDPDNTIAGPHAYQLWTARDLTDPGFGPNDYYCWGQGQVDDVKHGVRSGEAASVMEGVDVNCCDWFDPDEVAERGIITGHEIAHVYGEENHRDHCQDLGVFNCNIMKTETDVDNMNRYFVSASEDEIVARFFSDTEP